MKRNECSDFTICQNSRYMELLLTIVDVMYLCIANHTHHSSRVNCACCVWYYTDCLECRIACVLDDTYTLFVYTYIGLYVRHWVSMQMMGVMYEYSIMCIASKQIFCMVRTMVNWHFIIITQIPWTAFMEPTDVFGAMHVVLHIVHSFQPIVWIVWEHKSYIESMGWCEC